MARIRGNYVSGTTTDDPLLVGATTLNSAGLADLPAVTGTDVAAVVLYDGTNFEIVHVTAHTAAATSATISRAQEGSTAQEWAAGTTWLHGPTVADLPAVGSTAPTNPAEDSLWYDTSATATPTLAASAVTVDDSTFTNIVGADAQAALASVDGQLGGGYTDEQVRDVMATALVAGSNVTITPNDAADTITIAASGGGTSELLASVVYNPTTFGNKTLTTSDADLDATNLAVSFTVPASGAVIAKWSALCVAQGPTTSGSTVVYGTFREGSSTVAGSRARLLLLDTTVGGFQQRVSHSCKITGLTASASKTWKAGGYCALGTGGSPSARIDWGDDGVASGINGPVVIEIWSA